MIANSGIEPVNDPEALPGRILVVDDTPANVKLLEDMLAYHGFHVEVAADGETALELIRSGSPDLILLDIMLPGLDGYGVCRAVRSNPAYAMLPIVMVTALDGREERVKGLEAGADDFLSKPVNPPELLARVRSLLRIRRLYETVQRQADQLAAWRKSACSSAMCAPSRCFRRKCPRRP